jgi:hypothetical protein
LKQYRRLERSKLCTEPRFERRGFSFSPADEVIGRESFAVMQEFGIGVRKARRFSVSTTRGQHYLQRRMLPGWRESIELPAAALGRWLAGSSVNRLGR